MRDGLSKIIADAANMQRPVAPDISIANVPAPGAYGADKNPSYFYDPATRKQYLEQFGIKGNEATRKLQRQYHLDLQAYEAAQKAAAVAKKQLVRLNNQMLAQKREPAPPLTDVEKAIEALAPYLKSDPNLKRTGPNLKRDEYAKWLRCKDGFKITGRDFVNHVWPKALKQAGYPSKAPPGPKPKMKP